MGGATTTTSMGGATGGSTTSTGGSLPPECSTPADCVDSNPCTSDDCVADECVHASASEGVTPPGVSDSPNDCVRPVCHNGALMNAPAMDQVPMDSDLTDCTAPSCDANGQIGSAPVADGISCGMATACSTGSCSSGNCTKVSANEGMVIQSGGSNIPTGSGDCRDLVCQGGSEVLKPNFLHCADGVPGNCNIRPCGSDGICGSLQLAPAGTPCDNNGDGTLNSQCDGASSSCP